MKRTNFKQEDANEMDQMFLHLFDSWCERRSVIPLAYLMHAWPILTAGSLARIRLQRTLLDLKQFHADSLTHDDHWLIERVLAIHAHVEKDSPEVTLS